LVWVELQSPLSIGAGVILFHNVDGVPVIVRVGIIGVEPDSLVAVRNGPVILLFFTVGIAPFIVPFVIIGDAPVIVCDGEIGVAGRPGERASLRGVPRT
jgi:hypothetical protein